MTQSGHQPANQPRLNLSGSSLKECFFRNSMIGRPRSAIAKSRAKLKPDARYIVFYCADNLFETGEEKNKYYESIGLVDAYHPQTILAYEMNDQTLPIANGAPLRLRVERQLGYKMAKYVMRIEAVDHIAGIRGGRGGFWEDRGYEWYAGI
jgi:DMSO/TMAO reductase YedYZ molybdopterin-dependent catalytic subunit